MVNPAEVLMFEFLESGLVGVEAVGLVVLVWE